MKKLIALFFVLLAVPASAGWFSNSPGSSGGGGGSGCVPGGGSAATNLVLYGVSGACSPDTNANATAGTITLGASGTLGSVTMGNTTSGLVTIQPVTGALGTVTVSIPAATDTLVNLAGVQTLTNKTINGASNTLTVRLGSDVSGTLPVANGGTGLTAGTSGGVLAYTATGTLASSAALTANLPVIGGGAGAAPSVGTRSGNTTAFVTTTGTQTSGDCVKIDANGNHVANGSACGGGGGGSLTVTDGTNSVSSTTTLTVPIGQLLVGGSAGSATITPVVTDTTTAGSISSWNIGGQNTMSSSGTATLPTLTAGQSFMLVTGSGATATITKPGGVTLAGSVASQSTLAPLNFLSCVYNSATVYDCATGGVVAGANPSATAGDTAVNGTATTFMRSDGAPAIQKTSASVFGLAKVDGVTVTASGGVISAVGGAATTITPGTTTIVGATAPCLIENSTSTTMACPAVTTSVITAIANATNTAGGIGTVGTSGATVPLLNGTNTFSGTQTFGAVVGGVNAQTGTTYTLAATDCGQTVKVTNASAITVTTFQAAVVGCSITVVQGGAGQITFANGGSATLVSAHSYTKTFNAAGATVTLQVLANGGSAAVFTLSGDGA